MSVSGFPRHTGHFDGVFLRCVALRHGWTRSFSISPEEIADLDYESLARILELATLKLRSNNLRIFVESPPDSGTFCRIAEWRDDGSLQSVLTKQFFRQRLEDGELTRFEIRDGRERSIDIDDTASEGHGATVFNTSRARSVFSLNFFSRGRRTPRPRQSMDSDAGHDNDIDQDLGPASSSENRFTRLFNYLFSSRSKRAKGYTQQLPGDIEEATPLQTSTQGGGGVEPARPPPDERSRLLASSNKPSLRQKLIYAANNHGPFFSSGGPHRAVGHPTPPKPDLRRFQQPPLVVVTHNSRTSRGPSSQPTPVEEVSMWETESTIADEGVAGREAPPGLITAFWRSFWAPARPTSQVATDAADTNGTAKVAAAQKMKRMSRTARRKTSKAAAPAEQHFKGAVVVRRPEDALPPPRPDSAIASVADRPAAEDDPFRG